MLSVAFVNLCSCFYCHSTEKQLKLVFAAKSSLKTDSKNKTCHQKEKCNVE